MSTYSESFRFVATRRPIQRSNVHISALTEGPNELQNIENLEAGEARDRIEELRNREVPELPPEEKKTIEEQIDVLEHYFETIAQVVKKPAKKTSPDLETVNKAVSFLRASGLPEKFVCNILNEKSADRELSTRAFRVLLAYEEVEGAQMGGRVANMERINGALVQPIIVPVGRRKAQPESKNTEVITSAAKAMSPIHDAKVNYDTVLYELETLYIIQEKLRNVYQDQSYWNEDLDRPNYRDMRRILDKQHIELTKKFDQALTSSEKALIDKEFGEAFLASPNLAIDQVSAISQLILEKQDWAGKNAELAAPLIAGEMMPEVLEPPIVWPVGEVPPTIKQIGYGDLILARHRIIGYEAYEIAHIENILPHETRKRVHRLRESVETTTETEVIRESEDIKDLQSSERFEVETEANEVAQLEFGTESGVNVTADYGTYKVDASLDANFSYSKERSESSSQQFAKEVIERSIKRIKQKDRSLVRRIEFFEKREKNVHGFDFAEEDQSYSGVYRWVRQVQEVELRHYGSRLMIELFVPEPGVFLLNKTVDLDAPKPPLDLLRPDKISEDIYLYQAGLYNATNVPTPPPYEVRVGESYTSQGGDSGNSSAFTHVGSIEIPEGYYPYWVTVRVTGRDTVDDIELFCSVGGTAVVDRKLGWSNDLDNGPYWLLQSALPGNTTYSNKGVPVSVRLFGQNNNVGTVQIEIRARRTKKRYQTWQMQAYNEFKAAHTIMQEAYEDQMRNYELERQLDQGNARFSTPSDLKRRAEREELKKAAIMAMRLQSFDFNGVANVSGIPEPDYAKSLRYDYIASFFDKAFEWDKMAYFNLDYFFGRRNTWEAKKSLRDNDHLHESFLRAGAARVFVPVTPGMELRVLHYLHSVGSERERISATEEEIEASPLGPNADFNLWQEALLHNGRDVSVGGGTLSVTNGSVEVQINGDSNWEVAHIDVGREVVVEGVEYELIATVMGNTKLFIIDRPYEGVTDANADYSIGGVRVGKPWTIRTPTNLIILNDQADQLNSIAI